MRLVFGCRHQSRAACCQAGTGQRAPRVGGSPKAWEIALWGMVASLNNRKIGCCMARSKRKTPISGITTAVSEKSDKVASHRRIRRVVRQAITPNWRRRCRSSASSPIPGQWRKTARDISTLKFTRACCVSEQILARSPGSNPDVFGLLAGAVGRHGLASGSHAQGRCRLFLNAHGKDFFSTDFLAPS